jgi:hypothetical protein
MKRIAILTLLLALSTPPGLSAMEPPIPMTPTEFGRAMTGQPVTIVVRVTGFKRTALVADLLARQSDSDYKATRTSVNLYFPQDTPIIMGSSSDIKPGAILFVYGVATTPGHADVKKVVVVTSFIRVE